MEELPAVAEQVTVSNVIRDDESEEELPHPVVNSNNEKTDAIVVFVMISILEMG
jgi:hypothetical protein